MRYLILQPTTPTDPRACSYLSLDDLHAQMPVVTETNDESIAADMCRAEYPGFVAMPIPIDVGSGKMVLMGLVSSHRIPLENETLSIDKDVGVPFVMFVQAVADNSSDRTLLKKRHNPFERSIWKAPVMQASLYSGVYRAELRATDLDFPTTVDVIAGRTADGRLVIRLELNSVAMSLAFHDPALDLDRKSMSDARETVAADGSGDLGIRY